MSKSARRQFKATLETLEHRQVMAATAVLASGTLTVTGSAADDTIIFRQISGVLRIDGVATTYAVAQVQRIVVNALAGNDSIRLDSQITAGQQAITIATTVNGGDGHDVIYGSEAKDVLFGDAGNDTIWGNGGDDYVDGGLGADLLYGLAGNDELAGDAGTDRLLGGDGNDRLSGGDDIDTLSGGLGIDSLDGGRGNDILNGDEGNDALYDDLAGTTFGDTLGTNLRSYTHFAWFDMNLLDAGLRGVSRSLYVDQSLSRADMLALFARTGADGSVNASELADLRLLAGNGASLGMTDAVRNLSGKVVNSDLANLYYQATTLGNLAAGSTAAQLQRLVNKWFLGLDRPAAVDAYGRVYAYASAAGSLFVGGVNYADVYQGMVGDCYILASLAEVAYREAAVIQNMFTDNGDGTFTVRFYKNGVADYVTVDRFLPVNGNGQFVFAGMGRRAVDAANELWVMLAEKAYVQLNASGWIRTVAMGGGKNNYSAIAGGWVFEGLKQITGRATTWSTLNSQAALVAAVNAGKMIGLSSKASPSLAGVVGGHAYAIVGYNATTQKFSVFNPWGINNGAAPGLLTLSWSELTAGFAYWDSTV